MQKLLWFGALVIVGVLGVLVASNQSRQSDIPQGLQTPTPALPSSGITPLQPSPSQAQTTSIPTPVLTSSVQGSESAQTQKAIVKTSKGDIELILYRNSAPNTVNNFVKKSQSGFYNSLTFHRVEDWVIQGGDPKGNGTGGGQMVTELNDRPFVAGSLGVARGGDINVSNDAQFFITKTEASWLNKQYTNFGTVTKGMDVVTKMAIGDKILGITIE